VTWGTSPQDVVPITGRVPDPKAATSDDRRRAMERSLEYMGLEPGTPMEEVRLDKVFIGSCTNGRIEDLRVVAGLVRGKHVAPTVQAMIVPGSGLVKHQPRPRASTRSSAPPASTGARRCSHVPRHEPGPAEAGGAVRVD
jgi:3-isopropylmalate/(R)-2-methylmalate dehydratase large subunit